MPPGASGGRSRRRPAACSPSPAPASPLVVSYAALIAGYWPETDRLTPVPVAHLVTLTIGLPLLAAGLAWMLGGRDGADVRAG